MEILKKALTSVKPGMHIRVIQPNGNVYDGVVIENDNAEAMSLRISSTVFLRYDGIAGIEIPSEQQNSASADPEVTEPVQQEAEEKSSAEQPLKQENKPQAALYPPEKRVEIPRIYCNDKILKDIRGQMIDTQKQDALNVLNKYQTSVKNRNKAKLSEAIDDCWRIMRNRKWENDPTFNTFYAHLLAAEKKFLDSCTAFCVAGNFYQAALAAYQGVTDNKDSSLYNLAGAMAVLCLLDENAKENHEIAAEVLKKCAKILKDVSFADRILASGSDTVKEHLTNILWSLCGDCGKLLSDPVNPEEALAILKDYFTAKEIELETIKCLGEESDDENDEESDNVDVKETVEEPVPEPEPVKPAPILTKKFDGYVESFDPETKSGIIRGSSKKFEFQFDVVKGDLRDKVLYQDYHEDAELPVRFVVATGMDGSSFVSSVEHNPMRIMMQSKEDILSRINKVMNSQRYEEIEGLAKELFEKGNIDDGYYYTASAFLALMDKKPDDSVLPKKLHDLTEKYAEQLSQTTRNLDLLCRVYTRFSQIEKELEVLNKLIELCSDDVKQTVDYTIMKANCYKVVKDYPSAISQWKFVLELVDKQDSDELLNYRQKANEAIASFYCLLLEYEKAAEYAEKIEDPTKRALILAALPVKEEENDEPEGPDTSVSLSDYYEEYLAGETYRLNQTEEEIFGTVGQFPKDKLYALLTWLNAVSDIAASAESRESSCNGRYTVADMVASVEQLFSAVFRSPLTYREDYAAHLIRNLECAEICIPDIAGKLFAAASMRAVFHHNENISAYTYEQLCDTAAGFEDLTDRFPQIGRLLDQLLDFRKKTGYGINLFAEYRTNNRALQSAIDKAKKCLTDIDNRLEAPENSPRARRTRHIIFGDPEAILRAGLGIVIRDERESAPALKEKLSSLFLRSGNAFCYANLDVLKIESFLSDAWTQAKIELKREKHHVKNANDDLIGSRHTNIIESIDQILCCICGWIEETEQAETENSYARAMHDQMLPDLKKELRSLAADCAEKMDGEGFEWGTESIRCAAEELLAKLEGFWNQQERKYFFIDFLRSGDVLLDENYRPARNSTFCDLPDFTLPVRILRHAQRELPSLEDRMTEIFKNDPAQNNFRSAQLIRDYGEEMGLTSLSRHAALSYYATCFDISRKRLDDQYNDFLANLQLYEQFGSLSDLMGEKSRIQRNITAWYHICARTGDHGFYTCILEAYKAMIADNAEEHGRELINQLQILKDDGSYEFGVYPPEKILGYIEDQNFTVAENMLNCVRRHDVAEVSDYAEEPFGYLNTFLEELPPNHRAVADVAVSLEQSVLKYSQKKDLERALRQISNSPMKDVRGGVNLISSWVNGSSNPDKITRLLNLLGISGCTAVKEEGAARDSYLITCPERTGKVTYPHPIAAFGSIAEREGFRVLCLYGSYDCGRLLDVFRDVNTVARHTIVFLDYPLNIEERRKLARKLKETVSFAKTFLVIDRVLLFYLARHYSATTVSRMMAAVGMPFAYYQPFVEKSSDTMPAELFTGRENELVSIEQPGGANLVYGGRQLGKSALLKMAQKNIDRNGDGARAVLVDILHLNHAEAAKKVSARLVIEDVLPEGSETDDWEVLTGLIEKRLRSSEPYPISYLLLMLDEADDFIKSSRDVEYRPIALLKDLMSGQDASAGRFKFVMAGLHDLSRFNRSIVIGRNSVIAHLSAINIKPFSRPEAVKLLTYTLSYLGLRFKDESVISLILTKTNYFPGLIQLYCQKLLETMRGSDYAGYGQFNTPPYAITENHFKRVLTDRDFCEEIRKKLEMTLFVEEAVRSHYHIIAVLLSHLYYTRPSDDGYTPEEIYALAEREDIQRLTALGLDSVRELMREMWDLNVLTARDDHYVFATQGFREMLGNETQIRNKIDEYFAEGLQA